jgi:hypothetical protein
VTVSAVGTPTGITTSAGTNSPSAAGSWSGTQPRTAGDLLLATVTAFGNTTAVLGTAPAGWALVNAVIAGGTTITAWYSKVAAGGDAAPTFTGTLTGTAGDSAFNVVLEEFSDSGGGTPVVVSTGSAVGTTGTTLAVTTDVNVPVSGCLAVATIMVSQGTTAGTASFTTPTGYTAPVTAQTASLRAQMATYYSSSAPTSGAVASCTLPKGRTTTSEQAASIVLIAPPGTAAGPMLVQHASVAANGVTSVTAALPAPATAVNCLVANVTCENDTSITSVKLGSSADNWAAQVSNVTFGCYQWADPDCAGGSASVVVAFSGSEIPLVDVYEFSGLAASSPLDKSSTGGSAGTGAAWTTGATATTTQAAEVAVGFAGGFNAGGTNPTITPPSSPWVNSALLEPQTGIWQQSGYQIASSTAAFTYNGTSNMTGTNNEYGSAIGTYKAAASSTPVSGADTGTGTDTASVGAAVSGTDTAAGADIATLAAAAAGADTGTGTDTATVGVPASGSDTAAGTDTASATAALTGSDAGAGTDTASVAAAVTGADTAAGTDSASVGVAGTDTGAATDTASVGVAGADTGAGTDTASVAVAVTAADTAAGADSGSVGSISGADTATGTDTATVLKPTPPFPQSPLDAQVELNLSGTWTDITSYAYQRDGGSPPITITRGRQDEQSQCSPTTVGMQWNNRDGRFSPRNPTGPYYGSLFKNVPVRVSAPAASTYLRLETDTTSYASCPASAGIEISGDLDLRIDVQPSNYQQCTLAVRYDGGTLSWAWLVNDDGRASFWFADSGGTQRNAISTVPLPDSGRWATRVTLAASTGVVTFYTAATIGGSWTQLGNAIDTAATSLRGGTSPCQIGYSALWATENYAGLQGRIYAFQILSGIGGTVKASPDFTTATAGASTLTDAESNVWTVNGTAEYSGRDYRVHAECSALPQQWDTTGTDVWTPVTGGGILRRLSQGQKSVISPMKRAILAKTGILTPVAYHPMEETAGAASLGSATGGPAASFTAGLQLAADSNFACSLPIPTLGGSEIDAQVPAYASNGAAVVRFLLEVPASSSAPNSAIIMRVLTTGTAREFTLRYTTGGGLALSGWDSSGANLFDTGPVAFNLEGGQWWLSMELQIISGSLQYSVTTLKVGAASANSSTGTISGSVGNVTGWQLNPNNTITDISAGHVFVQSGWESLFDDLQHLNAWTGETAAARFVRLCSENNLTSRIIGWLPASVVMGAQTSDTLLNLLQLCETSDMGMMFEPRQAGPALGYRTLTSMLNQAPTLTLDYPSAHLGDGQQNLDPQDDDQLTRNDITVTDSTGATYQVTLDDGSALSLGNPPDGVGDYPDSQTVSVFSTATQLPDLGGWRLHIGTADEERYPLIPVNLARPELSGLTADLLALDIGDYLAITNPPAWLPPGDVKQLAAGAQESLGGFWWLMSWNGVPETPYEAAISDDLVYGHADTDGSELHANITSTATSMAVDTTGPSGVIWTTAAADFPFDVMMGGEQITVTNITGSSSPQTFTVTRSVNGVVKAQTAGEDIRLAFPAIAAVT